MTIEIRFKVLTPEAGILKGEGKFTPGPAMAAPSPPSFARRPESLENKTVYLVDTGFGGGSRFMIQLQKWFAEHMPSVKTVRKRKPGNVFMDDNNELWDEIKQEGDAVVFGVAG